MTTAWILMTAMPPTKGHINLIKFAASLTRKVRVVVCTQPGEPFVRERIRAVEDAAKNIGSGVNVYSINRELPQDPNTPGFWNMWEHIMLEEFYDWPEAGDLWVSSEAYGQTMADMFDMIYMPYDPNRELLHTKATEVREAVAPNFKQIANEFQHNLRVNVTVFGAESTGKTTLSKILAKQHGSHWFYEWARPYLETVGPDINVKSMTAIWHGQAATQRHSYDFYDTPYAIFDTDLYSTIGYWEQPHWADTLGPVPEGLIKEAKKLQSDLYIITKSNIPFEEDPLRYGGDKRESPDEFWIDVAERYGLNYIVLESSHLDVRQAIAGFAMGDVALKKWDKMKYDRGGF